LAGKRAKCKCGTIISVPASMDAPVPVAAPKAAAPRVVVPVTPAPTVVAKPVKTAAPVKVAAAKPAGDVELDDLYDLAPSGGGHTSTENFDLSGDEVAPPPLAPVMAPAFVDGPTPPRPVARRGGAAGNGQAVLGYRGRPTAAQKDRFATSNLIDMTRDVYAPIGVFLAGFALYVGYHAFKYELTGTGFMLTFLGLGIMTAFKAVLLMVFAMIVASPLGVSFGGIWTAALKFAAIAAFSDGVTTIVEAALESAGASGMSGIISFPISLGVYWALLIYLFSMDSGDSWLVVLVLAVFDYILRWALLFLLLSSVLSWGGVAAVGMGTLGGGGAGGPGATPESEARAEIQELIDSKHLHEARAYVANGKSGVYNDKVEAWYAAGAKTVWFETGMRDINGRSSIEAVVIELPTDPAQRAACHKIVDDIEQARNPDVPVTPTVDDGMPYLHFPVITVW
jgi:hypothetical protein